MTLTFSMPTTETPEKHYFLASMSPLWQSCERLMFTHPVYSSRCVSWVRGRDRLVLHHPSCFSVFGSNSLIGCFKSISENVAEMMPPNVSSKRTVFVKTHLVFWSYSHEPSGGSLCTLPAERYSLWSCCPITCYLIKMSDDNKSHRSCEMKSYRSANTRTSTQSCAYISIPKQAPAGGRQTATLVKYFISNPFSQRSTFVGAQYIHTIET